MIRASRSRTPRRSSPHRDRMLRGWTSVTERWARVNNPSVSDAWNTASAEAVGSGAESGQQRVHRRPRAVPRARRGRQHRERHRLCILESDRLRRGRQLSLNGQEAAVHARRDSPRGQDDARRLEPVLAPGRQPRMDLHSLMAGTGRMNVRICDDPLETLDGASHLRLDHRRYLLDSHSVTAQFVYVHRKHRYPDLPVGQTSAFAHASGNPLAAKSGSDTTDTIRAKLTVHHMVHATVLQSVSLSSKESRWRYRRWTCCGRFVYPLRDCVHPRRRRRCARREGL